MMRSLIRPLILPSAAALVLTALAGRASAQHFDALFMDDDGQLVAAGYNDAFMTYTPGLVRVFEGDVDPTEPGLQSHTQAEIDAAFGLGSFAALPTGEDLSFRFLPIAIGGTGSNLWFWPGGGAVDFQPVAGNSLTLTHPVSLDTATVTGSNTQVAGFTVDTSDGNGVVHQHLESSLANGAIDGFTLLAMQFEMAGLLDSEPLIYVLANGAVDEADHEAAVDWALENLVNAGPGGSGAIPEPSTLSLIVLGGLALRVRRRRSAG